MNAFPAPGPAGSRASHSRIRRIETSDPDEFAEVLRHGNVKYLPMAATQGRWRMAHVALPSGALYAGRMGAPVSGFGAVNEGLIGFAFRLRGAGQWIMNGAAVAPGSIAVRCRSREVGLRLDSDVEWAVIYLPEERFARRFRALTGRDAPLHPGVRVHSPLASLVGNLRLMVESALALAKVGAGDERTWRAFEEMLTDEVVPAFDAPGRDEHPEYSRLIGRCNEFLEAHPDEMLTPADLCERLQVGERTLRRFFRATYGQNPARFLRLRRMSAVRRALMRAHEAPDAVTRAAMAHGFFELGRFAADYRAVVGESPSETVKAARVRAGRVSETA